MAEAVRIPSFLLALALALGCGPEPGEVEGAPSPALRVALLTPGSTADGGWNQGAYEGLLRIRAELGAEISHVETRTPADFEDGFRDYASRGFDLVFGHGFEYQQAAAKVASEFPATVFITTSGNTVRPNLAPMVFELEQATYLAGFLAGRMSRTGTVGMVGGIDLPSIRSTFLAFRAGAEASSRKVVVREVFIGNFSDTASAREAALALLEEGADFLIHQANDAGRGVFQAVADRAAAGETVYAFGTNRDQREMAPEVVIASAVIDLPGAFLEVARRVREGTFEPAPLHLGMAEGIVDLVLNPELSDRIPVELMGELRSLDERIRSGEFAVPRAAF
jgi:basic membrane lipoprotein Med (substrate-binding protein (PBP1-ABC) superfamily)